jgi:hypothetical protein
LLQRVPGASLSALEASANAVPPPPVNGATAPADPRDALAMIEEVEVGIARAQAASAAQPDTAEEERP